MEYQSTDLLVNSTYTSKQNLKFVQYMALKALARGIILKNIDQSSIKFLQEKFNFVIDPLTDYIENIHDYSFYLKDGDHTTVYVLDRETKREIGTIGVSVNNDNDCVVLTEVLCKIEGDWNSFVIIFVDHLLFHKYKYKIRKNHSLKGKFVVFL